VNPKPARVTWPEPTANRTTSATLTLLVLLLLAGPLTGRALAAPSSCGPSGTHQICVSAPSSTLSGETTITITNSPNSGNVYVRWVPNGKSSIYLITRFGPSPATNDYSFVWPTQKYADGTGTLQVRAGSTSSSPVSISLTLSNGGIQSEPGNWSNFLPSPVWSGSSDPVVPAVGDGPDDGPTADAVSNAIAAANPPLFLFLGDVYDRGSHPEMRTAYGANSMDGGTGTLWGRFANLTQATVGNHEYLTANASPWRDYWHQRPKYVAFRFGGVLFLDLDSNTNFTPAGAGSAQYTYVKGILEDPNNPPPPCIVAFFHHPTLIKGGVNTSMLDMWQLLVSHGGDLVLNGHVHNMSQSVPLNDQVQAAQSGQPSMVQLVAGSGGHSLGGGSGGDSRFEWSKGSTPGILWLTLDGAASGGTATSLSWVFRDLSGSPLHTGHRNCGAPAPPPPGPIARVGQVGTVSNTFGVTTDTLSVPVGAAGVAQGDTVILGIAGQGTPTITAISDSRGNTYRVDAIRQYSGTGKCTVAIASAPVTTALVQGDTISVTLSVGNAWGFVAEDWSGLSSADQTGTADSNSTASTTVSVSTPGPTAQANEAAIAVACAAGQPGITAGGGYTLTADLKMAEGTAKRELGSEYQILSTTGVQTASFALGSALNWAAAIVTYS
jgi:hypothetical protein